MKTYVYFIGAVDSHINTLNAIKIGISQNPTNRLQSLQTDHFHELVILKTIEFQYPNDAQKAESLFHNKFKTNRIKGEWFEASASILKYLYNDTNSPHNHPIENHKYQTELRHQKRVLTKVRSILKKKSPLSAKVIQNQIKWAGLNDIQTALDTLIQQDESHTYKPKRTQLYCYDKLTDTPF